MHFAKLLPGHGFPPCRSLWIMLGAAVALALLIYLASHLAICGARRMAATKAYRRGVQHAQTLGRAVRASSLTRLRKLQRRRSDGFGGGSGKGAGLGSSKGSEAGRGGGLDPTRSGGAAASCDQAPLLSPAAEDALRRNFEEMIQRLAAQPALPPA